jgi:hypothetical protein
MPRTHRLNVQQLETREVPAGDLAYALQLTGLAPSSLTRVVADPIGNVYVAGNFTGTIDLNPDPKVTSALASRGGTDVFVAKYSNAGQLLWKRQLGGKANDTVADLALDGIANVYVGGTFTGAVDFNPDPQVNAVATAATGGAGYLWKLGYNGDFLMARTIAGQSSITNIAVDGPGRILATGQFNGTTDFNPSPTVTANLTTSNPAGSSFLWKLDQGGTFVWARAFTTTGTIQTSALSMDGNGSAYLAGRFTGTVDLNPSDTAKDQYAAGSNWTPFVTKLNPNGDYLWGKTLQTTKAVTGAPTNISALSIDGAGNVYTAGVFAGTVDFDPGSGTLNVASVNNAADGFVWKLNGDGSLNYARAFGGKNAESVSDLAVDSSGLVYVTGAFTGVADFDPSASGVANLVSGSGVSDTFVLKLNRAGNLTYVRALGGGNSTTRGSGIFADGVGNIYLTGNIVGTGDFNPGDPINAMAGGTGSGYITKLSPAITSPATPTNQPATGISAGGPYVINEGDGITLKATGSDPEGKKLVFNWDVNGDGVFGDAMGQKVVLTWAQLKALGIKDGTNVARKIQVRVGDGVNLPVLATGSLTINNIAPVAKIFLPATASEGVRPKVSFKIISEFSPKDVNAGFRASWDFNDDGVWDLGDGATYAGSVVGAQKIPLSFVDDSGPLAIHVRVFDKDGGYTDSTGTLLLKELPPTAMFSMVGAPRVGSPATFLFSNQNDSPADKLAGFKYAFDFNNDGVFEVQTTKPRATMVFPGRGTYVVNAAIIDKDGTFNVYQLTINVLV